MIFELNSSDYTNYIQDDSFNVIQANIGESWTDGNYKTHSNQILKVQGSFDMAFITDDEFDQFLEDIESSKNNDGYVECEIFVNNMNTTKQIECFLTISSNKYRPVSDDNVVHGITVEINEA